MKVGLVIYGSLDTVSGGYLYDRKLMEYLISQGDSVEIISQPWQNYFQRLRHNFDPAWKQKFAALNVDVLIQDELNHPSLFLINRAIRPQLSFPILAIVHHLRISEKHAGLLKWFYGQVEKSYLKRVDGFIWNSHTTRRVVEEVLGRSAPGLVAFPAGDRLGGLDAAAIAKRSQASGPLRLLFIGNLIPRKGLHTLISALAAVDLQSWNLRVVGRPDADIPYARRILLQVEASGLKERIQFLGSLPESGLVDELSMAQVLVMVSEYEGFGIVYLEGMSFGLPAIASTAGAAGEIIQNGINGWLVPAEDPLALTAAIGLYIQDRALLKDHSLAARRHFSEFPTWAESSAAIRQFLVDFLQSQGSDKA